MFLELSVLHASGSRRPCEREPSSFCPVRKRQWREPLPGLQRTWDSLAGLGARRSVVYGRCPYVVPPYIWAKHLQVGRESPVGQSTRKESGWAVGCVASKSGSRISRADKYARKGILGG